MTPFTIMRLKGPPFDVKFHSIDTQPLLEISNQIV